MQVPTPKIDVGKIWSLTYRFLMSVITSVAPDISELGLETKELFVLAELDAHPHPAELADVLSMPKPTVTMYVKRLEAAGFLRREIDGADLRRHRLILTPEGRKTMARGLALLSKACGARLARLSSAQQLELATLLEKLT
jgi:DNA-binding MarR family transcriptional regulator